MRGFRDEALPEAPSSSLTAKEDDDDFLKAGRKQTEERLDKALSRVKSMVRYPEARDQYRRLLTVVTEIQESKVLAFSSNCNVKRVIFYCCCWYQDLIPHLKHDCTP